MTSPINIPAKPTRITATVSPRRERHPVIDHGLSPTYNTMENPRQSNVGSPVYDDSSRVFFPHHNQCSCRGSGVGCDCSKTCSC
ncbi:hypothetical protein RMATCC62417_10576 [Rhizopus microsporus]|nr:hypothetical protein RMATCC62417_10576 [Rhizopus microsporus]